MLCRFSLRLVLPFIISLFVLLVIGISFYSSSTNVLKDVVENRHKTTLTRLSFIQGTVEQFLRAGQVENIRSMVASLSSEPDLIAFTVTSNDGTLIASNSLSDVGHHWKSVTIQPNPEQIEQLFESRSIKTVLTNKETLMDGYSSLCATSKQTLRVNDCGFIFYRINMAYHYDKAIQSLRQQAFFTSAGAIASVLGLLLIIHLLITRRVGKLIEALKLYTDGNRTIRSQLTGNDELSWLSSSINQMLQKIESDEQLIMEKEERLKSLFHAVADPIITIDHNGIIRQVNRATVNLFGYSVKELVNHNVNILMPETIASKHDHYLKKAHETGDRKIIGISRQLVAKKKNGQEVPIALTITDMNHNGEKTYIGIIRDITERKMLEESLIEINQQLELSANSDGLTNLSNRRNFDQTLKSELNRATRSGLPLSLLMCDVDHFKQYNDSYGHVAGDECLQQIASTMKEHFTRSGELPCRYGGEEFAVILPSTDASHAEKIANLLLNKIRELNIPHLDSSAAKFVTLSIGYSSYTPTSKVPPKPEVFIEHADQGLYTAKSTGRNQVVDGPKTEGLESESEQNDVVV